MSKKYFAIDATIDPKYGNFIRTLTQGDDLEKVLETFCKRARFIAAHTEKQLLAIHKKNPELISDIGQER